MAWNSLQHGSYYFEAFGTSSLQYRRCQKTFHQSSVDVVLRICFKLCDRIAITVSLLMCFNCTKQGHFWYTVREYVTFVLSCIQSQQLLGTWVILGASYGNVTIFLWEGILLFLFHGSSLERCTDQNSLQQMVLCEVRLDCEGIKLNGPTIQFGVGSF